ncbi:MAG: SDR family oxidoreductase [Rhodospirillaceae bacterium]|nr:SDR family oxidoreductase [Rhodospirillaceae bacterium]MYF07488.1 SDR family oxidoreductase [Rhodospirillaceae bacterium]MYH39276.1 SDR family oxidoreductase [Rhodospirillaceae bacterium]MYJ71930.1 SDR family oxidoreductase [Rhodospirillaceae bacterium]
MSHTRSVIVTGAGSGIGRAVALAMQADGYNVALAGRRADELDITAARAAEGGGRMLALPTDVTDDDQVARLFARTVEEFGRLDVLFNNAGRGAPLVPMEELTPQQWRDVVDLNLTACFVCAQHAIRIMKAQDPKGGRIINNGSISAHTPRPFSAPYTSTKHGLTGLTKCIALDGRPDDITACQIDIGNAVTDMTERMVQGMQQPSGQIMVEPRMDVEHVATSVLHMANLPLDANALFMTIMATKMPHIGRG